MRRWDGKPSRKEVGHVDTNACRHSPQSKLCAERHVRNNVRCGIRSWGCLCEGLTVFALGIGKTCLHSFEIIASLRELGDDVKGRACSAEASRDALFVRLLGRRRLAVAGTASRPTRGMVSLYTNACRHSPQSKLCAERHVRNNVRCGIRRWACLCEGRTVSA